jgi:regulator of sirC expression with transglutaminase-like and TPR domain
MNQNELHALISLLEDPDEAIFAQVHQSILLMGGDAIADLELSWENCDNQMQQSRIEIIIQEIQFKIMHDDIKLWITNGGTDLLSGALIIAKYQFPDLNINKINTYVEQLKQDVWIELTPHLTALEQVRVINHILFEVHSFVGNNNDFHHPHNSFINMVLESKKGNPLSLSIIYSVIAQKLGMPVYGVNLPQHFILAYMGTADTQFSFDGIKNNEVLFYVNAFSKGTIFNKKEVEDYLKQLKLNPQESYYYPCSNIEMIKRMVNNLVFAFDKLGQTSKTNDMKKLLTYFK